MKPWLTLFVDRPFEREPRLALFLDRRVDVLSISFSRPPGRRGIVPGSFSRPPGLDSFSPSPDRPSSEGPQLALFSLDGSTLQGEEPWLTLFVDRCAEREPRLALFLDRRVDVESCSARFPLGQIVLLAGRAAVGLISPRRIDSPRGRTVVCS